MPTYVGLRSFHVEAVLVKNTKIGTIWPSRISYVEIIPGGNPTIHIYYSHSTFLYRMGKCQCKPGFREDDCVDVANLDSVGFDDDD